MSRAAEATASSLDAQQAVVAAENQRLADDAKAKLGAAQDAQRDAQQKVSEEAKYSDTLTAQLADLKDTSAAVEQNYRAGVEAQAAYEAQQEARRRAAEAAAAAAAAAAQAAASGGPAAPVHAQQDVLQPNIPGGAVNDPAGAQAYASSQLGGHGWGGDQMGCLLKLWNQESSWMTNATNPSSGAYGVAQALPPEKYASTGADWLTSYRTQINWGLGYIASRYGSPCGAWDHEVSNNWY